MASKRLLIDAPSAFTPNLYGLQSVVTPQPTDNPHWRNGVEWVDECGPVTVTYDECLVVTGAGEDAAPAPASKTGTLTLSDRGAQPFTVVAEFDCSMVGFSIAKAVEMVRGQMDRLSGPAVEAAFWSGSVQGVSTAYPHLAADTTVLDPDDVILQTVASPVVTGSAIDIVQGVGLLEAEIGVCYGGQGTIHVPAAAAETLFAHTIVESRGGKLYTKTGHLVSVGAGYTNTGPDGVAASAGEAWLYATSPVWQYKSEVQIVGDLAEQVNRAANTRKIIAEQTYLLGWGCCHAAVLVNYGLGA